ncbi:hypothetical protein OCOJLMKI_0630 [Methylobacterium iners]|uniref:Uncharacterized protein n=1 Tax=Methylobacterium iners TaxID=418707 RepID=A0ABQ4RRM1_9HYPH|nr:hypothetical protein OCOJLMKI_0630 [Methylobacterium iners]
MIKFLLRWAVLSIPLGIAIGKFIKAGKGPSPRDPERR